MSDGFVILLAVMFASLFTGAAVACATTDYWHKAAVEHHAAHWEVDSGGNTTFVWDEPTTETKP